MAVIGILRHAQTIDNVKHRKQGVTDSPLTTFGRLSAARRGEELFGKFKRVFCSDLGRAVTTCELLNLGLPVQYTDLLRERDWDGETDKEMGHRLAEFISSCEMSDALIITHGRTARMLVAMLSGTETKAIPALENCECRVYEFGEDLFGLRTIGRLLDDYL